MTTDLGPGTTPRPVPTTEDRMRDARTDTPYTNRIPVHAGCGHTPAQHRHDDGQAADAASQDRAIRELEAELAGARGKLRSVERERDRLADELDSTQQVATYRQGVIDLHGAELGAAGEVIAVVRDAQEQIERALARYDTAPEAPLKHVSVLANCISCGAECPNGRCPNDVPAAGLGSASPRAQDDRHAQGYAEAIAHLRDDARYMHWWSSTGVQPAGPLRQHLADYLETVGPGKPQDDDPASAEQAARDRVEHAIRARLAVAWKTLPIDEVWLDQVAAVAATAAVNELREG